VAKGTTLRTALLRNGLSPHNSRATLINCRGLGMCGTCAVQVVPTGAVFPQEWNPQERLRLAFPPHSPPGNQQLRLACQVVVEGNVSVVKRAGFWGQKEQVRASKLDWFGGWILVIHLSLARPSGRSC
jgi:ferredoxin